MLGGMLLGYEREGDMCRAFRYGVAAGAASVTKYVFVLGASTLGDLADTENGIKFAHTINTAPADVVAEDRTCLLKIFRGGDLNPVPILAANPADGSVVIACVDGDFTVKTLRSEPDGVRLEAANPAFAPIRCMQEL